MDLYLPNRPKYVNFILRSHILILLRTFLFEYDRIILLDSSLLFSNPSFLTLYFDTSWSKSFGLFYCCQASAYTTAAAAAAASNAQNNRNDYRKRSQEDSDEEDEENEE